jgi:hypothetical protein
MVGKSLEKTLRAVVDLLVKRKYAELEKMTAGVRLKAAEIESVVNEYGRTIADAPAEAYSNVDVIPIRASAPPAYSVRFRLFTVEEGASDLELQATLIDESGELMRVEIDDILVA